MIKSTLQMLEETSPSDVSTFQSLYALLKCGEKLDEVLPDVPEKKLVFDVLEHARKCVLATIEAKAYLETKGLDAN